MFSKKLIHVNSFYRNKSQSPFDFVFNNPNPSLAHVRRIELLSASFMNSETNINENNNKLSFIKQTPIVRTLTPNSVFLGNHDFPTSTHTSDSNNSFCDVQYKYYHPKSSTNLLYYLVFFINPKEIYWRPDQPPKTGASITLTNITTTLSGVNIPTYVLPRLNSEDEIQVLFPIAFLQSDSNSVIGLEFTVTAADGTTNIFQGGYTIDFNNFNLNNDSSIVPLEILNVDGPDLNNYLALIPIKTGNILRGFHYLVMNVSYDDYTSVTQIDPAGGTITYVRFPNVNDRVAVCSNVELLYRDDFLNTNIGIITIVQPGGHTMTYAYTNFDIANEIVNERLVVDQIEIPIGDYTMTEIIPLMQTAFLQQHNLTMSKINSSPTFFDVLGRLQFQLSTACIFDRYFYDIYNPMSYIIGLTGESNPHKLFGLSQRMDTIPDLSNLVQLHITSDVICQNDKCLKGNNTSDSTFAVIPVTGSRGNYSFWSNNYSGEFFRTFNEPTDLRNIDIQLRDVTGQTLKATSADCSLVFLK